MSKLWYKPDSKFQTPKACVEIHFNSPESYGSPEAAVLTTLFLDLLLDYLNEHGKILYLLKVLPIQVQLQ
jgi:insulysin